MRSAGLTLDNRLLLVWSFFINLLDPDDDPILPALSRQFSRSAFLFSRFSLNLSPARHHHLQANIPAKAIGEVLQQ